MEILLVVLVFICATATMANEITVNNNCPFMIWPGIQGNPGYEHPANGGFALDAYQTNVLNVPNNWEGRIWARTQCDDSGYCLTGDCGSKIECNGDGGNPPVSLAEITLKGGKDLDYYDVSLDDGYNLPIKIAPTGGFSNDNDGCKAAGCNADLNDMCPAELAVKMGEDTIACNSACEQFNTDQYCCRGDFGHPDTCKPSDWPVDYASIFKQACPDAYSYAYDNPSSTFSCKGDPDADYEVVFCP